MKHGGFCYLSRNGERHDRRLLDKLLSDRETDLQSRRQAAKEAVAVGMPRPLAEVVYELDQPAKPKKKR